MGLLGLLGFGFGFLFNITAPLFTLIYFWHFLSLGTTRFVNHYYMKGYVPEITNYTKYNIKLLLSLISALLWICQSGSGYSVDALIKGLWGRFRGRNTSLIGDTTCSRWKIWFIRAQVVIVFFFATSTKIQEDWLRGLYFNSSKIKEIDKNS